MDKKSLLQSFIFAFVLCSNTYSVQLNNNPTVHLFDKTFSDPILQQGLEFEAKHQWKEAINLYLDYLKKNPSRVDLWLRVSDLQFSTLKQQDEASKTYAKITKIFPRNDNVWQHLSQRWQGAGKYQEALKTLDEAIKLQPNNMSYQDRRLHLVEWLGLEKEVKKTFTIILNKYPNNTQALASKIRYYTYLWQWADALDVYSKYLSIVKRDIETLDLYLLILAHNDKSAEANNYLNSYRLQLTPKRFDQLSHLITNTIQSDKRDKELRFAWLTTEAKTYDLFNEFSLDRLPKEALNAEEKKDTNATIQFYHEFLKTHPDVWEAWLRIAILSSQGKNVAQTIEAYTALSQRFPQNTTFHKTLLYLYDNIKNKDKLLFELDKLLVLNPKDVSLLKRKFELLNDQKKWAEAIQVADTLIPMVTNKERYQKQKGYMLLNLKKYPEALELYSELVKAYPERIDYQLSKASILQQLKQKEAALAIYNSIILKDPRNKAAYVGAIDIYGSNNKLEKALRLNKQLLTFYPNDKPAHLRKASILIWEGAYIRAYINLQRYKKKFGTDFEYEKTLANLYAVGGRANRGLELLAKLEATHPQIQELKLAKINALYNSNHFTEAVNSINKLYISKPEDDDIKALHEQITDAFRPTALVNHYLFHGSDGVEINKIRLNGGVYISPVTAILGEISNENAITTVTSPSIPVNGCCGITFLSYWLGLKHQLNPTFSFEGHLGNNAIRSRNDNYSYLAKGTFRFNDYVTSTLSATKLLYDTSPLAISLGINQNLYHWDAQLKPGYETTIEMVGEYSTFSDTNTLWSTELHPYVNLWNSQYGTYNIGIDCKVLGNSKNLTDGYYSPSLYQYYAFLATASYNINRKLSLIILYGIGKQKDNNSIQFGPANDYRAEMQYIFWKDWVISASGGYSTRLSNAASTPGSGYAYNAYGISATLSKRF